MLWIIIATLILIVGIIATRESAKKSSETEKGETYTSLFLFLATLFLFACLGGGILVYGSNLERVKYLEAEIPLQEKRLTFLKANQIENPASYHAFRTSYIQEEKIQELQKKILENKAEYNQEFHLLKSRNKWTNILVLFNGGFTEKSRINKPFYP